MVDLGCEIKECLGVEVSRTAFNAVIVGDDGRVESSRVVPIENSADTISELVAFVSGLSTDFGDFKRIGLALPGLVDREAGIVALAATNPAHTGINIIEELSAATGLSVAIENDANAAAYGEYKVGAGRGDHNFFYVTLGEGVGGAFLLNDKLWHGKAGFAGEFGFVPIDAEGMRLEEVASAENIVRRTRSRFHQDNTSSLNKLDEQDITLDAVIDAAIKNDDFAQMMLKRTGWYVGTAVATVINLLNIEKVIIGGEIMRAKELVIDSIISRSRELSFEPFFNSTTIVEGELGTNAAAIGAAFIGAQAR